MYVAFDGNASVMGTSVEYEVFQLRKWGNALFLKTFPAAYS